MPNYNIVVTSGYKPYTFDEMIKPLTLYKTEFDKQVQAAETLGLEAAKRLQFLDENLDGDQYREYMDAVNEINSLGNDIANNGIDGSSLSRAINIRRKFQSLVTPLDYALEAREKEKELYKKYQMEHPEILITRDPYETPVSQYYPNAKLPGMSTVNLNTVYNMGFEKAKAFASQFSDVDIKRLDDNFYKYYKITGLTGDPNDAMEAFPQFAAMQKEIEDSIDFSKFKDKQQELIRHKILEGIKDGITQASSVKTDLKADPTAAARYYARMKGLGNGNGREDALLSAYNAKPTGEVVDPMPTSSTVREAVQKAKNYLHIDTPEEEKKKAIDYTMGMGAEGDFSRLISDDSQTAWYNPNKVGNLFKPVFKNKKTEKKRDASGNYVETISDDEVVEYELNLDNPNTPDSIKKDFIKTFEALGITVHNGDTLKDLQEKLDAVSSRATVTVDTPSGKVIKVKTDNNMSFAEVPSVQLKLSNDDAKKALSNFVTDMIGTNGKFMVGSVRKIKGAASIDGNYAGTLDFGSEVSPSEFSKNINEAASLRVSVYKGKKDTGLIVKYITPQGKSGMYFINAKNSTMKTTFTNMLSSGNIQQAQKDKDKGFVLNGQYIPYLNFGENPRVRQLIDELDAHRKFIAKVEEGGYNLTAAKREQVLKDARARYNELVNMELYKNGDTVVKLGDVYQAYLSKKAYVSKADELNRVFSNSYLDAYKGSNYDNQPTTAQIIKYGDVDEDFFNSGALIVPDEDEFDEY